MFLCQTLAKLSQRTQRISRIFASSYTKSLRYELRAQKRLTCSANGQMIHVCESRRRIHFTLPRALAEEMNEGEYEALAQETLDELTDKLELLLEEIADSNCDVVLSDGVMTLILGEKGTYVINKQTPNRQIWFSSPISGPKRYDYLDGQWIYRHDGKTLKSFLTTELEQLFGRKIQI